jgi:hypothetical protein
MLLSDSEGSFWGTVAGFYEWIEAEGSEDLIEFESYVWGKLHRKGLSPCSGDGIAFYHTTNAGFPRPDPYKGRPRISLIGELRNITLNGQNVDWLSVRIRRRDLESLRRNPIVRDASTEHLFQRCGMVRGSVATFYEVPPEVWTEFQQKVYSKPLRPSEPDMLQRATPRIDDRELEAIGAGFGDAQKNKQVERAAVAFVKAYFQRNGWHVESVEGEKCGYDLRCRQGHQEKHVEIKGVSGTRVAFVITERELTQAKENPKFCLCVVTAALSQKPRLYQWAGERVLKVFAFRPLRYAAKLLE